MNRKSVGHIHSMCVQPTFLIGTYNEDGSANFAPITWVSVTAEGDGFLLVVSMYGTKMTKRNALRTRKLSANLVSVDMLPLMEYFGSSSGNYGIKNQVHFQYPQGQVVAVPTLEMSRWVYECEVVEVTHTGDSDTFFCEVKNVQIDEKLDISEGINLMDFDPVIYSGHYHSLGAHLGKIGDFYKK